MAEERNLATVRAPEADDVDSTKAELQRRMEEARESITQTVTEIKDTVANQYQSVKESVTDALDWREQYRRRPLAFSIGALSAGFILGYSVAGTFKGDGQDEDDDYWSVSSEETDLYSRTGAEPAKLSSSPYAQRGLAGRPESLQESPSLRRAAAPAPAAASSYGTTGYEAAARVEADYGDPGYDTAQEAEPNKPGLMERFKETRAYDRLQEEVGALGDRFVEEFSNVGQTVVLPMLFGKIKELFGVDLSGKQGKGIAGGTQASSSGGTQSSSSGSGSTASTGTQATGGAASSAGAGAGSSAQSARGGGGSSYATSENRDYQSKTPDRT